MTPEDQTPPKPTNPGGTPDGSRPTPWTPPTEDGSVPSDATKKTDASSEPSEHTADSASAPTDPLGDESAETPRMTGASQTGEPADVPPPEPTVEPTLSNIPSMSQGVPTGLNGPTSPVTPNEPSAAGPTPQPPFEAPGNESTPAGVPVPSGAPTNSALNAPKSKMLIKLIILVVVLVAVVAAGFFGYKALKHSKQAKAVNNALDSAVAKSKSSGATDISSLQSIKFEIADSAVASLVKQKSGSPTINYYTNADNSCFFAFGTADDTFVKGANVSEIVQNYLNGIRQAGATVSDPTAADPRILKDAKDKNKQYAIPSLDFSFSQGKEQAKGYYSAAMLKGGDRALIETACDNKNGPVDNAQMTALNEVAKQITVAVQS